MSVKLARICAAAVLITCCHCAVGSAQRSTPQRNPSSRASTGPAGTIHGKIANWWQHQLDLYYGRARVPEQWTYPGPPRQPIDRVPQPLPASPPPAYFTQQRPATPIQLAHRKVFEPTPQLARPRPRNSQLAGTSPTTDYPRLNSSLYPMPHQNIPIQMGGTFITNPAFAPHEMMYGHSYKAMYPPFYYRVKGGWLWTPFGMESHDQWELMGTEVNVKYRTEFSPLANFKPPKPFKYQKGRVRY